MKVKKNPRYDLRKWSIIFFQVGLAVMLLITWQAMEWKSYDLADVNTDFVEIQEDLEEVIPITEQVTPPPPPPPQTAPSVIIAVEDAEDVEESIIESTETSINQEIAIVEIEEIEEVEEEEEIVNVPFAVIENVPIFPGCENLESNDQRRTCMSKKVQEFVQRNFNIDLASELGLEGRQRIFVQFRIDRSGKVVDVRARAPHPRLEQEAVNIVCSLPKMEPGKQRGKAVGVQYALPILFDVKVE